MSTGDLTKFDHPVPRYTSYPTAPQFQKIRGDLFQEKIALFDQSGKPLSLYIHIPFCKSMCLFCACSVTLNRSDERQERYFNYLLKEIEQTAKNFSSKKEVTQLHLGGGTPTNLTEEQFVRLMDALRTYFTFKEGAEISIEVDPRNVFQGTKLKLLKELGFNRVSFGVQDMDPKVQEAIRRRQSEEMTVTSFHRARELGFDGINVDLIYGLPCQTLSSFQKTAEKLIELKPDRIAFYSYAKVPWLKPHQKAIPDDLLPSREEKFQIYVQARDYFLKNGYVAIGMDHFALAKDSIAKGLEEKKLTRNFQGYSLQLADDMIGLGVTSIGFLENTFFQNEKDLSLYEKKIEEGSLAITNGFELGNDDVIRRYVILSLMCHFELDKDMFEKKFGVRFDDYFASIRGKIDDAKKEELLIETKEKLVPTKLGCLFIRIVASIFDAYLEKGKFSKAI